eukprot:1642701-Prymnesium_polylepis.3
MAAAHHLAHHASTAAAAARASHPAPAAQAKDAPTRTTADKTPVDVWSTLGTAAKPVVVASHVTAHAAVAASKAQLAAVWRTAAMHCAAACPIAVADCRVRRTRAASAATY